MCWRMRNPHKLEVGWRNLHAIGSSVGGQSSCSHTHMAKRTHTHTWPNTHTYMAKCTHTHTWPNAHTHTWPKTYTSPSFTFMRGALFDSLMYSNRRQSVQGPEEICNRNNMSINQSLCFSPLPLPRFLPLLKHALLSRLIQSNYNSNFYEVGSNDGHTQNQPKFKQNICLVD